MGYYGSGSVGTQLDPIPSPIGGSTPGGGSSTNQNEIDVEDDDEEEEEEEEGEEEDIQLTQPSFTQLLQQPGLQSNEEQPSGPKNWSLMENEALVSAYMNTSCDSITGTNQTRGVFWKKVVQKYEQIRETNPEMPLRTPKSLRSRWNRLADAIMKWVGCYDEAKRRQRSGQNEADIIREAHMVYESSAGSKFLSELCWKQLMQFPKWQATIGASVDQPRGRPKQAPSHGSESSGKRSRDDFEGDDTPGSEYRATERPDGVKKTKAMLRGKGKTVLGEAIEAFDSFGERLKIHSDARVDTNAIERERLQLQREKLAEKKRQRELEEYRMNWDILTALRSNPDRLPHENRMLEELNEWFKNYKRFS